MRAQCVYENINFERGAKPTDALQVGRKHQPIKEGDIIDVYFDIKDTSGYGEFVKVRAETDVEYDNSPYYTGPWFEGIIIEPNQSGHWQVTWDDERSSWIITDRYSLVDS